MPPKIAVCIPCAPKDRGFLRYCLASVQAQTRKPDLVVVSLSVVADINKVLQDLSNVPIPVEYVYSPKPLMAGANRNLAATRATEMGANILSFFDADDIMHPQRIERIEALFVDHPELTGLLHHFIVGPKADITVYKGERPIPWEPVVNDYLAKGYSRGTYGKINIIRFQDCFKRPFRRGYGMGACGHATVITEFWKANPYLETINRGEDNHFIAEVLIQGKQLGYTGDTLSCYMRADFRHFQVGL